MASVAPRATPRSTAPNHGRVAVIADAGAHAWVVLVHFATAPRLGDTFSFRGLEWVIVREKDAVRGFVAHPRPTLRGR